jgi:hypothetical protein
MMVDLGLEVAFYTLHVRSNCSLQVHLGRAVATNGRCLPDMCHLLRRLLSFERQIACEQLPIAPGPNAAVSVTVPQRVVRSVCRANTKSATHARTLEPWNLGVSLEEEGKPASACDIIKMPGMFLVVCKRAWNDDIQT